MKKLLKYLLAVAMIATCIPMQKLSVEAEEQTENADNTLVVEKGTLPSSILDKAEMYLPFENNTQDSTGKDYAVTGDLTYDTGTAGQGAVFTKGSYVDLGNIDLGNKTISFSFKSNKFTSGDPAIMGNKDWNWGGSKGLALSYGSGGDVFHVNPGDGNGNRNDAHVPYTQNVWMNVAIVFDETGQKYLVYVDGTLKDTIDVSMLTGDWYPGAYSFKLGNDGTGSYGANSNNEYSFTLDNFMVTNGMLSAEEIAMIDATFKVEKETKLNVGVIGADTVPADSYYSMNIHLSGIGIENVKNVKFDVEYDSSVLEYSSYQSCHPWWPGTNFNEPNKVTIEYKPGFDDRPQISGDDFITYSNTRIIKLIFKVKDIDVNQEMNVKVSNIKTYSDVNGTQEIKDVKTTGNEYNLTVLAKDSLDYNKDGVIGAGDVALAPSELKETVAKEAAIYPYKRVIALTIDGAGNVWDPENAHYDASRGNAGLDNVRNNPYAMWLHNEVFATSYTAQSVNPPISAQNYSSILTGTPWINRPNEYKATNESLAKHYWSDFGKEEALYPTIFKAIYDQAPNRLLSSMSEWAPINDGMIEPDISVFSDSKWQEIVFDYGVEKYISEHPEMLKRHALLYLQSDEMDHYGHGDGYFTDGYYQELQKYDNYFKTLVETLQKYDLYDDTLIISNSDHGGTTEYNPANSDPWGGGHGNPNRPFDMDIYIGVGGQTVNSGKKLQGGSNDDIPGIILDALRLDKPDSMKNSEVFDSNMFLSQEELVQKNRDIEKVALTYEVQSATITLTNQKNNIQVVDLVLQHGKNVISNIETEGTILRQEEKNGACYLTIAFEQTPETIAKVNFEKEIVNVVRIHEVMLGTASGKEIYCDLQNETEVNVIEQVEDNPVVLPVDETYMNEKGTGAVPSIREEEAGNIFIGWSNPDYAGNNHSVSWTVNIETEGYYLPTSIIGCDGSSVFTMEIDGKQKAYTPLYSTGWSRHEYNMGAVYLSKGEHTIELTRKTDNWGGEFKDITLTRIDSELEALPTIQQKENGVFEINPGTDNSQPLYKGNVGLDGWRLLLNTGSSIIYKINLTNPQTFKIDYTQIAADKDGNNGIPVNITTQIIGTNLPQGETTTPFTSDGEWGAATYLTCNQLDLSKLKPGVYYVQISQNTARLNLMNGRANGCPVAEKGIVFTPHQNIMLNTDQMDMQVDESKQLTATIIPDNSADLTPFTWKSSNPNIATVDQNGLVTGVNAGTAVITVTTKNGLKATCSVTVTKEYIIRVDGEIEVQAPYNTRVDLVAPEKEGFEFAGWILDDGDEDETNDVIVCKDAAYSFYISNDMDLRTLYVEKGTAKPEVKPGIEMTNNILMIREDGKADARFVGQIIVPNGWHVESAGLYYSVNENPTVLFDEALEDVAANAKKLVAKGWNTETYQLSLTIKGMPEGRFTRGVIYAKLIGPNNETLWVHTDEEAIGFNVDTKNPVLASIYRDLIEDVRIYEKPLEDVPTDDLIDAPTNELDGNKESNEVVNKGNDPVEEKVETETPDTSDTYLILNFLSLAIISLLGLCLLMKKKTEIK